MNTMEFSLSSSQNSSQVQKVSDERSDCRRSPTTVIESDIFYFTKTISTNVTCVDKDDAIINAGFVNTDYEFISEESSEEGFKKEDRFAKLRKKRRERTKYLSVLPTIQEVSEEEEGECENKSLGFALLSEEDDISMHIRTLSPPVNSENEFKEVQLLIDAASQRAAQGNEEKALAIYKDGLYILKQEVTRISEQIQAWAMSEPKFEKTALYIILHEEWAESALVIADIRTMMATIYERHEDYDEALCCSEEARSVYQRQAIFDERHHRKGSCAREKEMSMEIMMEQIEEARESQYIRQSLHQTVERIHEKIVATTDETSRGFLYEDIFDKLSTALSLELMYLGETHPQIANTKGLLSMFYSEIKQHEKALRAMNDAVLICEMALGDSHPQTGTKYQETAKLYERIGGEDNFSKALDLYEKAIATLERAEGNVSERMCSSLNSAASLYIQQECYDIAIKKLKQAIHISEENYRERSDDISNEPIQLWLNLAECHALKGEPVISTEASRSALRIQRDKRNFYDASCKGLGGIPDLISNSKIAFTMKRLGKSLAAELKFKEAYDCFIEALSILKADLNAAQELVKFNTTIDLPRQEDEVACALYDLAKVKQADTKYTEATELYRESLLLRIESDKKRTVSERSNHINCAMCLAGIGSLELIQNEESEAFKSFNRAIYYAKQQGIPDSHPIALMLWDKSRIAANNMKNGRNSSGGIKTENTENDYVIISRLEEKAKESGDFENCVQTINIVINMKRKMKPRNSIGDKIRRMRRRNASMAEF